MIKTVQYNDLENMDSDLLYNKDEFLKQLIHFYNNGGNINYPIKRSSYDDIKLAEDFFRVHFKNVEQMIVLIEQAGLINPFQWKIEGSKIIENPLYGKYWYRDNTQFYKDYASKGFEILLQQLINDNIVPTSYEEIDTYNSSIVLSKKDPIVHLANKLNQSTVYDILFTLMPEYKKIYKEEWINQNLAYEIIKDTETSMVFFKHNVNKENLLEEKNVSKLHDIVQQAVYSNDIEFLKTYCQDIDFFQLEQNNKIDGCFLKYANTPEMAQYLLDKGCFVEGLFNDTYCSIFPSQYLTNLDTIQTILDYKIEYKNLVIKDYKQCYEHYFKQSSKDVMKLLINDYDFPVEKVDMLSIGVNIYGQEGITWALKNGADPRNCSSFIMNAVVYRDEGLSLLKKIHKNGEINIFYPDPLHHLLSSSPTKIFFNWLEKVSVEQLTRTTKNGIPAWFVTHDNNAFNFVIKKIENFNQLDDHGNSWLFHVIEKMKENSYSFKKNLDSAFKKHTIKNPENLLTIKGKDNNNNNIFHLFFKIKDVDSELLEKIVSYSTFDTTMLLTEKNNESLSVFDIALTPNNEKPPKKYLDNKKINCLFVLLNNAQATFDYDIIINDKKAIDFFRELFKEDNEKLSTINHYYLERMTSLKCDNNPTIKKMKI